MGSSISSPVAEITGNTRNSMVQIFRAISIIAVVLIHTTPVGVSEIYFRPFINFAVAAFLFLSGYLTKIDNNNWAKLYKKRLLRVVIPYIIWSIVYAVIYHGAEWFYSLPVNLLKGNAAPHLYYILVYIQFVLLAPLMGKLAQSRYRAIGWLITPLSCLVFRYFWLLPYFKPTLLFSQITMLWENSFIAWFAFYYLGLMLGNGLMEKHYSLKSLWLLYALSLLAQMAEAFAWQQMGELNFATQLKLSSILSSAIFALIIYTVLQKGASGGRNGYLRLVGDYSFGIYLCHVMIIKLLNLVPYYQAIPFPVTSVIILLLSIVLCYLGNLLCGKRISGYLGLR